MPGLAAGGVRGQQISAAGRRQSPAAEADDPGELSDLAAEAAHADVRAELLRRLYADWDPAVVRAASEEASGDWRLLVAHGKLFQSPHGCAPTLPADYEFFTQR